MALAARKKEEEGVYRSGWKSRHEDEDEDWANNGGSRVRRRLHSSSLTPHNTFAKQARLESSFLILFPFPFLSRLLHTVYSRLVTSSTSSPVRSLFFRGSLRLFLLSPSLSLFLLKERDRRPETMCTLALDTDSEAIESTNVEDTRFSRISFSSYRVYGE